MVAIACLSQKLPYAGPSTAGTTHVLGSANWIVLYVLINGLRVYTRLCPGGAAVVGFQARDGHGPKSSGRALANILSRPLLDAKCGDWICDDQ
jgi:hypothetical protein